MKKIIGICGSPRQNGNSETALAKIISNCSEYAIAKIFNVSQMNIHLCNGCLICEESGFCNIEDDMANLLTSIEGADIIVFSTPVYFDGLPAICKNILDNLP